MIKKILFFGVFFSGVFLNPVVTKHNLHSDVNFKEIYEKILQNEDLVLQLEEKGGVILDIDSRDIDPVCTLCEGIFGPIIEDVRNGGNFSAYIEDAIDVCVQLDIGSLEFCEDFLYLIEPEIEFVFLNTTVLNGKDFCGMLLVGEGCVSGNPMRNWSLTLNDSKPDPYDPPYDYSVPTMKVLHFADTHYDPLYWPGTNTNCPEKYLCCRNDSGTVENPEDAAGFWGDYRDCDAPKWLLELMYEHIAGQHPDIDFIIWTGDLVAHNVWSTSREENIQILWETSNLISKYFPNLKAYPSLGNHEGHPVNSFPQPYIGEPFDISWLYTEVDEVWSRWLDNSTSETILYGGYYVQEIVPGLKLLSINSNFCYGFNWWMVVDSYDVAQTLQFMANELQKAENNGESVYIVQHIPPGHQDCALAWSHEYNRIVNRYENTITGIFYGHTHNDHYALFFDIEDIERVYEIGYIGQGQSPYSDMNPGYKIYTIEGNYTGSKFRVLDHENWVMDLELANTLNATDFFKLYSAKDEYELPDLSPQSWYDFVVIMDQENSVEFDIFYRNYVKASKPKMEKGCDDSCKYDELCKLLTSDNTNRDKCDLLTTPSS